MNFSKLKNRPSLKFLAPTPRRDTSTFCRTPRQDASKIFRPRKTTKMHQIILKQVNYNWDQGVPDWAKKEFIRISNEKKKLGEEFWTALNEAITTGPLYI